jgi:thiamine-phosphate pyrophosphorylase
MNRPAPLRRGLYLVTRATDDDATLLRVVTAALAGGAVAVQYRDKSTDGSRRWRQARALRAACASACACFIVNDDVALAREVGADGVHLGEDDGTISAAREGLGSHAIIGVSCYDDLSRARALAAQGADYIAFGSFFSSPTKPVARRASPTLLTDSASLGIPRVAIGGITRDNAASLIAAGADLVAVISDIFDAPDPRVAASAYAALYASP